MTRSLNDIRYHDFVLGTVVCETDRQLTITSRLFEPTVASDFWLVSYMISGTPEHEHKFSLTIPVRIATTMQSAISIMKGSALDRIREYCTQRATRLSAIGPYFSTDGWVLT